MPLGASRYGSGISLHIDEITIPFCPNGIVTVVYFHSSLTQGN